MFPKILTQIFGSRNDRLLKSYRREVEPVSYTHLTLPTNREV